ncbi:hypothetical protein DPPLL_31830 [Desulfofustis limnaeus]|uniref:DUF2868 domain-containing protein n=2 Tax=Desulfofustis limnaeus TaxID=2740163 RepID=A0ABM7WCU4_9BACT|nr:hypothetical protein DPPLL_31830 [Desulfofustis limnaeus]
MLAEGCEHRFSRCIPPPLSTIIFATTTLSRNFDLLSASMADNWTYRDTVDLDYCLDRDRGLSPETIHQRDRQIFLDACQAEADNDRQLVACWLRHRLIQLFPGSSPPSPGARLEKLWRTAGVLLMCGGGVAGFGSGLAFFNYSGTTPVNVFHFLLLFVLPQLVLLVLVFIGAAARASRLLRTPSLTSRLYLRLFTFLARRRSDADRLLDLVRSISTTGRLLFWRCFILSQKIMICINGGLLAATLLKVATTDQAFGWQSTIQVSGPVIHRLAQLLAAPWSWLIPATLAHPSLADIEGSRIILKEGIQHLATENLVAWWPFLVFALIFYGLILRLLLLLVGTLLQRRALRRFHRGRPDVMRLLRRMQTPLLTSGASDQADSLQGVPEPVQPPAGSTHQPPLAMTALLALVPEDINNECSEAVLNRLLYPHGFSVAARELLRLDEPFPSGLLQRLAASARKHGGLLLLTEAWSPPINDWLHGCGEIRTAMGPDLPLIVGLLGFLRQDGSFNRPSAEDTSLWRHVLAARHDRYLEVIELGETGPDAQESSS